MNNLKSSQTWVGAGVLTAIGASLCCITPLLAVISGASSATVSFSWMEPFRPYLIGVTLAVLAFAWYQKVKPKTAKEIACACEEDKKPSFFQSWKFLFAITLLSVMLITFPYYSSALYGTPKQSSATLIQQSNLKWVQLTVKGMSCADCTRHIDGTLSKVPGVVNVSTSFEKAQTTVSYDPKKTSADSLKNKINQIGYRVTSIKIK